MARWRHGRCRPPAVAARGRLLELVTLGWNVVGIVVLAIAAVSGAISCVGRLRTRQPDRDRRVNGRALGAGRRCGEGGSCEPCGSSAERSSRSPCTSPVQSTVVLSPDFTPDTARSASSGRRSRLGRCSSYRGGRRGPAQLWRTLCCRIEGRVTFVEWHSGERGAARSRVQRCTRLVVGRSGCWLRPRLLRCSRGACGASALMLRGIDELGSHDFESPGHVLAVAGSPVLCDDLDLWSADRHWAANQNVPSGAQHNRRRRTGLSVAMCGSAAIGRRSGSLVDGWPLRSHRRRNRIAPRQGLSVGSPFSVELETTFQCSSCGSEHGSHPSQFPPSP